MRCVIQSAWGALRPRSLSSTFSLSDCASLCRNVSRMPWRRDVKQTPWTLDVERNTLPKILALVAPMPVAVHISMMQKHFSQNRFNACSWQAMTGLPCSCWLKICTSCQCLWCIRRPMRHISQLQKSKNCALSVYLGRQYCSSTD